MRNLVYYLEGTMKEFIVIGIIGALAAIYFVSLGKHLDKMSNNYKKKGLEVVYATSHNVCYAIY